MQIDVGNEPTLRCAYVTSTLERFRNLHIETVVYSVVSYRPIQVTENSFRDMNYCLVIFGPVQTDRQTDGQTESDAYEPTVQSAQVGSKKHRDFRAYSDCCWDMCGSLQGRRNVNGLGTSQFFADRTTNIETIITSMYHLTITRKTYLQIKFLKAV